MTDGPSDATRRAATYRRDLARLIAMSFSAGELSKYAERWRVFTDREGGSEGGARALVRAIDSRDKLAGLLESLRAHKPLVEWPDPPPAATIPAVPALLGPPPARHAHDDGGDEEDLDGEDEDEEEEEDGPASRPLRDRPAGGGVLLDPFHEPLAAAPASGLPQWLPHVAIGIAGIAVGATAMYLLHPERKSSSGDGVRLAQLAASQLEARVGAVADACEVDAQGDSAREVLANAFAECGVPELRPRNPQRAPTPASPPQPAAPRPVPRPAPRRRDASPSGGSCLDACHEGYVTCAKTACGSEPASAADYTAYQRCLHECQSRLNRCRLTCH